MDLHELEERWVKQLEAAETFLPEDPMAALDANRTIAAEIERHTGEHPEQAAALAQLLLRARAAFARSHEASERWLAACAERARRFHEHELERAQLPLQELRSPWPPRISA